MKPWEKYGGTESGPWTEYASPNPASSVEDAEKPAIGMAAVTGVNSLIPQLAGLPVDTVANLLNLGIAVYGTAKGALGGTDLPEPINKPVGGSEWFKDLLTRVLGRDVFSNPRPDSAVAEMLHTGSNIAAGGLLSPASSVKQAGVNIARMLPAGAGAAVGEQVSDSPLAPVIGALTPGAVGAARGAVKPKNLGTMETFRAGREAGLVAPPSEVNPTAVNTVLESVAGKAATRQGASIGNAEKFNKLVVDDLGLDPKIPVTEKSLEGLRTKAGQAYQAVKDSKLPIWADNDYLKAIANLGGEFQMAAKEFPNLFKNEGVKNLIDALYVNNMSPGAAVELSKKLRHDAKSNLKAFDDPEKFALGKAQRQAALLIEGLVEKNLAFNGQAALAKEWKDARVLIAKTHDAEVAFNPQTQNFDAGVLKKLQDKDKPLSGGMKKAADFAAAFPRAAQRPEMAGSPNVSALMPYASSGLGLGGFAAIGPAGAGLAALPFARPLARRFLLSGPYQNALARPRRPLTTRENALAGYIASEEP